jgi:hypothetical protein
MGQLISKSGIDSELRQLIPTIAIGTETELFRVIELVDWGFALHTLLNCIPREISNLSGWLRDMTGEPFLRFVREVSESFTKDRVF